MSAERFRYDGYDLDPGTGRLECRFSLGHRRFTEEITFDFADGPTSAGDGCRTAPVALDEAARLVYLLAGVSYYKTAAPPVVDLGDVSTSPPERAFLRMFFVEGLGEFALRNGIDLSDIAMVGPDRAATLPVAWERPADRPLVPFGAGIDSVVTVETLRRTHPGLSLFVVERGGERFDAIERTLRVTGLPVVRAARRIDPAVLRSKASGFLNGHVPVTGILSVVAVMAAVLGGFGAVVMSNERSASAATVQVDGHAVNHQWSKSLDFEVGLRAVLAGVLAPPPDYFSLLRARSELWVARRFAQLERYHLVFRSCNRAFYTDPVRRLDTWCGTCDKCCFIDLVLAPFLGAPALERIFAGREPLATPALEPTFRTLLGLGSAPRPFECVGDVRECRAAAVMAAERADRRRSTMLQELAASARDGGDPGAGGEEGGASGAGDPGADGGFFGRQGQDFVPPGFEPASLESPGLGPSALHAPTGRG